MTWNLSPNKIKTDLVQLEPLTMGLFDEVCKSLLPDDEGWYQRMFGMTTPQTIRDHILAAEKMTKLRASVPFAIRDLASNRIAGLSQFMKIDEENRHLEIGSTMIGPQFRRSYINTHAKFMMLREAFESLKVVRVSFRIDQENHRSIKAVERIGAKLGGQLRAERILPDGRVRDYFFFSIVENEWPAVKTNLDLMMSTSR